MSADTQAEEPGTSGLGEVAGRRRAGVLGAGGASPAGAARALLPDARVVPGRRGHRAGDLPPSLAATGDLRGTLDVPSLALPNRHQRLSRPARQAPTGAGDRRRGAVAAALPRPAARRAARGRRGRAGGRRRRAGDDRAGLPGRGPAPRAAPARRTDPADVLGWPAKDVADLLGDSVNSVNSALQRARAGMREHLPAERQDWTGGEEDAATRELVRRFTDASVATDVDALAAMLRDDIRFSMPPTPGLYVGRDAVVNNWLEDGFEGMTGLRGVLTSVNRQPAVAFYQWQDREDAYLPLTLDVLRITGGAITELFTFHDDQFPQLGLPDRLPADGTE